MHLLGTALTVVQHASKPLVPPNLPCKPLGEERLVQTKVWINLVEVRSGLGLIPTVCVLPV